MLINFDKTVEFICEEDSNISFDRIDISSDAPGIQNKFTIRPKGILIQDSYNNPFLPIKPQPRIDTAKADIKEIYRRYRELYYQFGVTLLPWHFVIELIDTRYFVFNTRPIDMKFPLINKDVLNREELWDANTSDFIKNNIFDISELIHILIIGDSNTDIYTKKFYEILGRCCIVPFIRLFKLPEGFGQRVFCFNIGKKFNIDLLTKFIRS